MNIRTDAVVVRVSILVLLSVFSACTHLGPQTISRDRFDYNTAISNSWKEQTLLNIVKLRYADMPLFVEVASVVSGYTLEGSLSVGGALSSSEAVQGDFLELGSTGKYTDRPTITYAPITGSKFNKSFMTPIPPQVLLFLMQAGWPVDLIFPITVDSINGLRSTVIGGISKREGDDAYYRVIELMRDIQKSGAAGMRVKKNEAGLDTTVLFFYREHLSLEMRNKIQKLSGLLKLKPGTKEVKVAYAFLPADNSEMAMITRSMMQIMIAFAMRVDVPEEHVKDGRTIPAFTSSEGRPDPMRRMIQIHHSKTRPAHAHTAVRYRNHWYCIDDRDFVSKRTFTFLMILFSLTESGGKEGLPLVTIPAG